MRTALVAVGALCVGLVAGFFIGRETAPTERPGTQPEPEARANPRTEDSPYPSKQEIIDYLDFKPITLSDKGPKPDQGGWSHTIRRGQIEALAVDQSSWSINDGPKHTDVTFILNSDNGRYAVKVAVAYRRIEKKCAFFGFEVKEVGRQ
jgi:hypothetical protein